MLTNIEVRFMETANANLPAIRRQLEFLNRNLETLIEQSKKKDTKEDA